MYYSRSLRAGTQYVRFENLLNPVPLAAGATSWTNPVSGLWSAAADWSGGVPTASDSVTVSVAGTYAITISAAAAAGSLVLEDAGATIRDNSTLTLGSTLNVQEGHFIVGAKGTVKGGTLNTGSGKIILDSGATLSGVTYDGTLDLGGTNQTLTIANGITLAGGSGPGHIDISGSGAQLIVDGDTTLADATVTLGLYLDAASILLDSGASGATLTLGPSLDFVQGNGPAAIMVSGTGGTGTAIVNKGSINLASDGHDMIIGLGESGGMAGTFANSGAITVSSAETLSLNADRLVNTGSILVTGIGSELIYDAGGTWTTQGALHVSNGAALELGGTFTAATFGSISNSKGSIYIGEGLAGLSGGPAELVNTGTLSLAAYPAQSGIIFLAYDGTIRGGTIADPHGALATDGGTLSGVTYDGTLDVGSVVITDGITLRGADGSGPGTVLWDGQGSLVGKETLNSATIDFSGDMYVGNLTLGPSLNMLTDGSAFISGDGIGTDTLLNEGTIAVSSGGTIEIDAGDFRNTGTVSVNGTASVLSLAGDWQNTGSIVDNGGTINFGGTFTLAQLNAVVNNGGVFNIIGDLLNTGTLAVGPNTPFDTGDFTGTIRGGAVSDPTGALVFAGGTLSGVTYEGTLSLGPADGCTIANGTRVTGAGGSGPGAIDINDAALTIAGNDTLASSKISFGDGGGSIVLAGSTSGTQKLTLAGSTTLTTYSDGLYGGVIEGAATGVAVIVNDGTIEGSIDITGAAGSFTNAGHLNVSSGAESAIGFDTGGAVDNTGVVSVAGLRSSLDIGSDQQAAESVANSGVISLVSGGSVYAIATAMGNTGSIIVNASSFVSQDGGVAGVTSSFQNGSKIEAIDGGVVSIQADQIANTGTMDVVGQNSSLWLQGTIDNTGTIYLDDGSLLLNTTLTAATLDTVTGHGGHLYLNGALDNTGATLTLGSSSVFDTLSLYGTITGGEIKEGSSTIGLSGSSLLDGVDVQGNLAISVTTQLAFTGTLSGALTNGGELGVGAGELAVQSLGGTGILGVGTGATLTLANGGTIASVNNYGTILAQTGTTTFSQSISGSGSVQIGAGATAILQLGCAQQQSVDFAASSGTLDLGSAQDFFGTIGGFGGACEVDLPGISATGTYFANGALHIYDQTNLVAELSFGGNLTGNNFVVNDSNGGVLVTFQS